MRVRQACAAICVVRRAWCYHLCR